MRHDELVRSINQICAYFDAYPDADAVDGVAEHLQKFWDPSMRRELLAARQELAQSLSPLAQRALERLADVPP